MPLLNWQVLADNQVTGTVFGELDDERVLQVGWGHVTPPTRPCQPMAGMNRATKGAAKASVTSPRPFGLRRR